MITLASTEPTTVSEHEAAFGFRVFNDTEASTLQAIGEHSDVESFDVGVPASGSSDIETFKVAFQAWALHSPSRRGLIGHRIRFFQCSGDSKPLIVADFGEPASEFPKEQQRIIDLLRNNGREILAEKLITMLRDVQEDPDEPEINVVSLQQMAQFFVEQKEFADPFIGPDSRGIVHAEWRIFGNGVLVMVFPDDGVVLLVAQTDETPISKKLDICVRKPTPEVLEEFGYLVPRRQ